MVGRERYGLPAHSKFSPIFFSLVCVDLLVRLPVVAVVRLVVHDELAVDEVEAVGPGGEGLGHHLPHGGGLQLGKVVDVLARVLAVGDAEAKVEVESLQVAVPESKLNFCFFQKRGKITVQVILEKVPLDHPEVLDRLVSHRKLHGRPDGAELEELGSELKKITTWSMVMYGESAQLERRLYCPHLIPDEPAHVGVVPLRWLVRGSALAGGLADLEQGGAGGQVPVD